jgi:hypothetical protein
MPSRARSKSRAIEDLRLSIDCLPQATREAMLRGVQTAPRVIAGAYVDGQGGVCPMLAAHRAGGRTDLLAFAHAWDRFTRARRRARQASMRELAILVGQLQASLASEAGLELGGAIAEHRALRARRERAQRKQGEHSPREHGERTLRERLRVFDPVGEIRARRLRARLRARRCASLTPQRPVAGRQKLTVRARRERARPRP